MSVSKTMENVAQVLHNNKIKFPKDFFRYFFVHQHGRGDVTWKPRIVRPTSRQKKRKERLATSQSVFQRNVEKRC